MEIGHRWETLYLNDSTAREAEGIRKFGGNLPINQCIEFGLSRLAGLHLPWTQLITWPVLPRAPDRRFVSISSRNFHMVAGDEGRSLLEDEV
jgi:hypothetical protein